MKYKNIKVLFAIMMIAPSAELTAAGPSGSVSLTAVSMEGGRVFITGAFANPDSCANSAVAVISAVNAEELSRMTSLVVTALAANKKISMWFSGCTPVPWYPSAPQATTISIEK